jgi:hypothetical protein
MQRYLVGFFLILHGVIHWVGASSAWGLDDYEVAKNDPWFDMSDLVADLFGGVWLAAMLLLAAAGVGVVLGRLWWRQAAAAGVVVSTIAIIPYVSGASLGLAANVIVVAILIASARGALDLPGSPGPEPV